MKNNYIKIIFAVIVFLIIACNFQKADEVEINSDQQMAISSSQAAEIGTATPSNSTEQDIQTTPNANEGYEVYQGLRNLIISTDPNEAGIEQGDEFPNVWGILLEFWSDNDTVTLVSIADRTTSLYFSNGGGLIGLGEYQDVAEATLEYISLAESYIDKMEVTTDYALPEKGKMTFYVLTFDGGLTISVDENELTSGNHVFSPLFFAANDVITQIRLNTPND